MSVDALRNQVRRDLDDQLKNLVEALTTRGTDTEAEIRVRIGEIRGIRFALETLDTAYRELN